MTGAELALTEPEKAIDHPSVDVVIIVTPTNTHARLIEVAANAGKAVFSEKPIALDLAETERIVQVVRERKVPVQLGFMRRYDPGYAKAKARIEAGELGKLETFRAIESVRAHTSQDIAAIGSRSKDKAEEFASRMSLKRAYGDYEELVAADDLDVIYVTTPHNLHYPAVMLALNAGKHVFVEKPIALNRAQALEMVFRRSALDLFPSKV